jgi:hypothetical protein
MGKIGAFFTTIMPHRYDQATMAAVAELQQQQLLLQLQLQDDDDDEACLVFSICSSLGHVDAFSVALLAGHNIYMTLTSSSDAVCERTLMSTWQMTRTPTPCVLQKKDAPARVF